jgi:predicted DNA-binding transcriptional regulator YafY
MRRTDRLSQIVQHLRGGHLVTAQKLGEWLDVSQRTIYRDIADLQSTGVPIDGEAGVGYLMRKRFDPAPLAFARRAVPGSERPAFAGEHMHAERRAEGLEI